MADQTLIDGLIATYRELNARVRPLAEDRLLVGGGKGQGKGKDEEGSVHDVVSRLRDSEMIFSQALKERITGVPMPEMFGSGEKAKPVLGTETEHDSTAALLSQFGTARESTLAMLRTLPANEWDEEIEGGEAIRSRVRQLHENDQRQMERIVALLGSP